MVAVTGVLGHSIPNSVLCTSRLIMSENYTSNSNELFKGVRFYTMGDLDEKIKEELINKKAKAEAYLSAMVTHAIVSDSEHYELDAAQNMWQIPTVTPAWVTMSIMCKTLLPTQGFLPVSDQLFSKVSACFSNIPKPDRTLLWALITFYGGKCQNKLNKHCTHLITPLPTGGKFDAAIKHSSITIVAPDWITDSVKSKQLQSCEKYSPELNVVPSPVKEEPSPPSKEELAPEPLKSLEKLSVGDTSFVGVRTEHVKIEPGVETEKGKKVERMPPAQPEKPFQKQVPAGYATGKNQLPPSNQDAGKMSPAAATPVENSQKITAPSSTAEANAMQMIRQQTPQFRPTTNIAGQRFPIPAAAGMRHPLGGPVHPMMVSRGQNPGQQVFLNQSTTGVMMTLDQRTVPVSSSTYTVVSSSQNRTPASPRRISSQSSGGKKKKPSNRTAMAGHPNMPQQGHPMVQFPAGPQAMFSQQQQQQMMQKMRMPGGGDQIMSQGQNLVEGGTTIMGPRYGGIPGPQTRFANPNIMARREESAQHLHQQQMLQQQQQQQMQRMALLRQSQSSNPGVMNQMERISVQQKWPRQSMDASNFVVDQQGHQFYAGHGAHQGVGSSEDAQSLHQVVQSQMPQGIQQGMSLTPAQNASAHQHYNPAMVNRFGAPLNPQQQQQQLMFQQMQQQQASTRFSTSSQESTSIAGISPFALQQGILNADMHADNPPLVHPSLQGISPKVASSSQSPAGSITPKKRSKSRKKTDTMDEEGKARQRQRTAKAKKSPVSTGSFPVLNTMQQSPTGMMLPPQPQFNSEGPKLPITRVISGPPSMSPAYGAQFSGTPHSIPPTPSHPPLAASTPPQILNHEKPPSAALPQTFTPPNVSVPQIPASAAVSAKKELPPAPVEPKAEEKMETEPTVPSRDFIDPLTFKVNELESDYVTHTPGEAVPETLFLLGCVFHITEYDTIVVDASLIGHWKSMIGKFGGVVEEKYNPNCTHLICATCATPMFKQALSEGKRCVTIYWLNDVIQLKKLRVPWLALHFPTQFTPRNKPATSHTMTYTNFHAKERVRLKMMGFVCGVTLTGYLGQSHTGLLCKINNGLKYDKAKSWSIPCINGLWLRDVLQSDGSTTIDVNDEKYQKTLSTNDTVNCFLLDIPKVQHILHSWKSPIVVTQECLLRAGVKHQFDPMPPSPSQPKRLKPDPNPQPLPRVCFTGLPFATVVDLTKKLESLNGHAEDTYALCTHLVAKSVVRTSKFLSCISLCSYVVTPDWIEDSFKSNWLLDEEKYCLKDKDAEENFKFSLQESIKRAKTSLLFKDCLFCSSNGVTPKKDVLKQIIECAGGKVLNKVPALSVLKHMKARKSPDTTIIIISCPNDEKFYKQLKKEGLHVHSAELVLTGVLKQELDLESYRL